ncbi:MAG: lysophospholipid acyltransferase family protein [Bdellovibrionales bacterium]
MRALLAVVRVLTIFITIFIFLAHMCCVWVLVRNRWSRVRWSNRILSFYCYWGLWVLGVKVNPIGLENLEGLKGGLFVGNHLTYMDVLAISSCIPSCFVTSTEIKAAPLLGQICMMAGCLFVERRNKSNILKEISEIREGLQLGLKVSIFPEATSTNGEAILRFRKPLFIAAIDGGVPVYPFCLNYHTVGGQPINTRTRDSIFWYGDMDFAPHLWALANSGGVILDLHFLPPIPTTLQSDATAIAEQSQRAVEAVFRPVK